MAGRGPQTFKKRQKEQARKEKQLEKRAKRLERKRLGPMGGTDDLSEHGLTDNEKADDDLLVNASGAGHASPASGRETDEQI